MMNADDDLASMLEDTNLDGRVSVSRDVDDLSRLFERQTVDPVIQATSMTPDQIRSQILQDEYEEDNLPLTVLAQKERDRKKAEHDLIKRLPPKQRQEYLAFREKKKGIRSKIKADEAKHYKKRIALGEKARKDLLKKQIDSVVRNQSVSQYNDMDM